MWLEVLLTIIFVSFIKDFDNKWKLTDSYSLVKIFYLDLLLSTLYINLEWNSSVSPNTLDNLCIIRDFCLLEFRCLSCCIENKPQPNTVPCVRNTRGVVERPVGRLKPLQLTLPILRVSFCQDSGVPCLICMYCFPSKMLNFYMLKESRFYW